jgi:drug/metabolite transporter (DMT)-like permease
LDEPSELRTALRQRRRALLILVVSSSLFGVMAFAAKLASLRGIPGAQVAFVRFAISILPVLLVPAWRRKATQWQRLDLLFYRGFFGGIAVLFFFVAIEKIPVSVATLLNYMAPLFSGIFAALFINERIRVNVVLPLLAAFGGVVLVVRVHAAPGEIIGFGRWEMLALLSAVCSGAAVTAIRGARRTESSWAVFGSFSLLGLLATAPFGLAQWVRPDALGWLWLFCAGAISVIAQLLMTHAFRWVPTLMAGVVSQMAVIVSLILGVGLLGETMRVTKVVGSLLTIAGVSAVVLLTRPPPSMSDVGCRMSDVEKDGD